MNGKRGRPPALNKPYEVTVHITLRPGEDDDLIDFFTSIPKGLLARTIITSLRAGGIRTHMAIPENSDFPASEDALDDLML